MKIILLIVIFLSSTLMFCTPSSSVNANSDNCKQTALRVVEFLKNNQKDSLALLYTSPINDRLGFDNDIKCASKMILMSSKKIQEKDILLTERDSMFVSSPFSVEYKVSLFDSSDSYLGEIIIAFTEGNCNVVRNLFVHSKVNTDIDFE